MMIMKKQITAAMTAILMAMTAIPFAASAAEEREKMEDYTMISISKVPDKTVYEVGETLDLTGGEAIAAGCEDEMLWDTFYQPIDSEFFTVDATKFDNSTPGTYTIYVFPKCKDQSSYASFDVTVLPDFSLLKETIPDEEAESSSETIADVKSAKAAATGHGDVNGDGEVNVMDLILVNKYNIGASELDSDAFAAADMNGDGNVDYSDTMQLLKKITM
jgi:hypothetical protein